MHRNMTLPNPSTNSLPGYLMAVRRCHLSARPSPCMRTEPTCSCSTSQVGPPGFTAFAFLNLGKTAVDAFPASNILGGAEAGRIFLAVSVWFSVMLYVRLHLSSTSPPSLD